MQSKISNIMQSLGINCKSRVLFPGSGFLPSAAWLSMPKKQSNGLINRLINIKKVT